MAAREKDNMSIVTKNKNNNVMLFLDLRNIINGAKDEMPGPFTVDFCEMARILSSGRCVRGAYVFDGLGHKGENADAFESTQKFHSCLQYCGFRMVVRDSYTSEEREQKEVDVSMACTMLKHAMRDDYDTAIVITGDRDFVPAIEMIQECGKTVEVASFSSCASPAIKRACDEFINLSKLPIMEMYMPKETAAEEGSDAVVVGSTVAEAA